MGEVWRDHQSPDADAPMNKQGKINGHCGDSVQRLAAGHWLLAPYRNRDFVVNDCVQVDFCGGKRLQHTGKVGGDCVHCNSFNKPSHREQMLAEGILPTLEHHQKLVDQGYFSLEASLAERLAG